MNVVEGRFSNNSRDDEALPTACGAANSGSRICERLRVCGRWARRWRTEQQATSTGERGRAWGERGSGSARFIEGRVWGIDIPRVHWKDKRPHERPEGPIIRKVIPSWAWGRTTSEADRHKAGSVRAQTAQQRRASNHNRDPTFPRWSPVQRNQARMSRQNYRKIDSISSLSLRCALLSYPHVLPHGRIYKA